MTTNQAPRAKTALVVRGAALALALCGISNFPPAYAAEQTQDHHDMPRFRTEHRTMRHVEEVETALRDVERKLDALLQEMTTFGNANDIRAIVARLERKLADRDETLRELQARLDALNDAGERHDSTPVDALERRLEEARERLQALQRKEDAAAKDSAEILAELDRKTNELERVRESIEALKEALRQPGTDQPAASAEELERQLAALNTRLAELRAEYEMKKDGGHTSHHENRNGNPDISRNRPSERRAYGYVLVDNHVVPREEPYFDIELRDEIEIEVDGSVETLLFPHAQLTRILDGEPVETAVSDGGLLQERLAEYDPESERLQLLVCPNSVHAYRLVVQAARQRNIHHSWQPFDDDAPLITPLIEMDLPPPGDRP